MPQLFNHDISCVKTTESGLSFDHNVEVGGTNVEAWAISSYCDIVKKWLKYFVLPVLSHIGSVKPHDISDAQTMGVS